MSKILEQQKELVALKDKIQREREEAIAAKYTAEKELSVSQFCYAMKTFVWKVHNNK